jgi:sulfoxide reductase heme-binding subunit YedZ
MDGYNTFKQHAIVGTVSSALVAILYLLLDVALPAAFARVSFVLLFITMMIGPIVKLKQQGPVKSALMLPSTWRGELGIWFTFFAVMHVVILTFDRPILSFIEMGGGGYGLANLLGLVALLWALILSATSCSKAIRYLGVPSWKWIQSFAYLIFYLVSGHYIYFQFFSTYGDNPGPDWFGFVALGMTLVVILLEGVAFVSTVKKTKAPKKQ